ncbi:MAG: zinc metalloprotease [Alphaproteobacteria bacterium]
MAKKERPTESKTGFVCDTITAHRRLARLDPEYRRRRREIELETREFIAQYAEEDLFTAVVRIPVVVHVVWNTVAQNVSDAQVNSQITALNEVYRLTNADAVNIPTSFAGVAADTRIEFALAVRDPNCGTTTGITRTNTATASFSASTLEDVKSAGTGGADPWPSDRYLNIWVCNISGSLKGRATFPGGPAALDGFVVDFDCFGTGGTTVAPFNLGRIAAHELGHWLNLLHIWADDQNETDHCSFSDECADTPNQAVSNSGTPAFPHVSCSNGPNGDMFMNHMDYTDDAVRIMFTQDQALRMAATLAVARAGIVASDGLVPSTAATPPDLWMQDNNDDVGVEPDPSTNPMWISNDIWVRNGTDGLNYQDHENPLGGTLSHVYVRVRNRGCPGAGSQTGTLKLYWAKASSSLGWPAPWDGTVTSPALMGGLIGSQSVTVTGGAQQILEFPWTVPNPSDYAVFGADQAHFCLLARIETSTTAPFGMTTPETGDIYANVQNNNNIVWKNITIVDSGFNGSLFGDFVVGNFGPGPRKLNLVFSVPRGRGPSLFDWGHILVEFRGDALARWQKGDIEGKGFQKLDDGSLVIAKPGATLRGLPLKRGTFGTIHVRFVPHGRGPLGARVFELDVMELNDKGRPTGGQRLVLKTNKGRKRPCWDKNLFTFDGVDWRRKYGGWGCGCG